MAKNGVVRIGTQSHQIMQLLADNGGSVERVDFRRTVEASIMPGRAVKTVNSVLERMMAEGFIERHVVLTEAGRKALIAAQPKPVAVKVVEVRQPRQPKPLVTAKLAPPAPKRDVHRPAKSKAVAPTAQALRNSNPFGGSL